jgi:hypothetical protein
MFSYTLIIWGMIVFFIGIVLDNSPAGVWTGLWSAGWIITLLSLCGIVFLAIQVFLRAEWPRTLSRIAEAMSRLLPAGIVAGIISLIGINRVISWEQTDFWTNRSFLLARISLYYAGWIISGLYFIYLMRRAGLFPAPHYIRWVRKASMIFMLVWITGSGFFTMDLYLIFSQLPPETAGLFKGNNMFAISIPLIIISIYILLVIRILEEKGLLPFQLEGLRYVLRMKPDPGI